MITAVDIENTFSNGDNMPYSGENTLVSCGYLTNTGEQDYLCFYHAEQPPTKNNVVVLQSILDKTTLLVGHNIKYDLLWLQACGFIYENEVWDTMGVEYLLARGLHRDLTLGASWKRREVSEKKSYIFDGFIKSGKGVDEIPWDKLTEYGVQDVQSAYDLAFAQAKLLDIQMEDWANAANN